MAFQKGSETKDVAISSLPASPSTGTASQGVTSRCEPLTRDLCCALQHEWEDLAEAASERNIFQFPHFILNSIALLEKFDPKIVTLRKNELLIGIALLRGDWGYAKLPVPFWRSALHHEQYLATPLVRTGFEDSFAAGLCDWIDNAPRDCGFVILSMISGDGPLAEALIHHCSIDGRGFLTANRLQRAAIAPARNRDREPKTLLKASRRKSIQRAMTKLSKQGEVSLERLSNAGQLCDWTAQFLAMENSGWKHESGSSILSCPNETALYKAMISDAYEKGNLLFSRLCVDAVPIAYTLDITAPPSGFCLKSAIDQNHRKFSPGVLMEYETLKHYLGKDELTLVDSCSAPDNEMLNEMWPDRKTIMDLAIARKGAAYGAMFRCIHTVKTMLKTGSGG